jgi:hypothetical protein
VQKKKVIVTILTDLSKDAELSSKSCCVKSERKTSPQFREYDDFDGAARPERSEIVSARDGAAKVEGTLFIHNF